MAGVILFDVSNSNRSIIYGLQARYLVVNGDGKQLAVLSYFTNKISLESSEKGQRLV